MSEDLNRELSVQELEEALRLDFDAPEDERPIEQILMENGPDITRLLEQTEVLAQAYKPLNITGKTARESIESHYRNTSSMDDPDASVPGKAAHKPWLRRGIAIAAVLALLVGIPLATSAFHWQALWNTVAKWAKETFSFVSDPDIELTEPDKQDQLQYRSLQDVLPTENGAHKLVPTWIPEGYVLEDITIDETPTQKVYVAAYRNGDVPLQIHIQSFSGDNSDKIEINEYLVKTIKLSELEFFIFNNMNQIQIMWANDSYVCCISCQLSMPEIEMMINSVGKG